MNDIRDNQRGISLGQLVVALVFIAIIVLVLFPIFGRGCPEGRPSCQSNLKEIALALNMYHGDYDNKLPSSALYNGSKTWNRDDFRRFTTELGQLPPPENMAGVKNTWPVLLYPHIKSKDILFCTKEIHGCGFWYNLTHRSKKVSTWSYWYKASMDYAWFKGYSRESDFKYPADQVIFYEHSGRHWDQESDGLKDGVTVNMAYMDGHVAARIIKNSGFKTSDIDPVPTTGEPAWFNHNNKTGKDSVGQNWNPGIYSDHLN